MAGSYFEGALFYFFSFHIFPAELFINKTDFRGRVLIIRLIKHVNYAAVFIFTDE